MFHRHLLSSIAFLGALACPTLTAQGQGAPGKAAQHGGDPVATKPAQGAQGQGAQSQVVPPQGSREIPPGDGASDQPVPIESNAGKIVPPGSWFETIHIDFGKQTESNKPLRLKGEYAFNNASGADQKITIVTSSCKCQELELLVNGAEQSLEKKTTVDEALKQPILVPKGAKGTLKLVFDVSGGAGMRSGHIRVDTTDQKMPTLNLTCAAVIDPAFIVEPAEVDVGDMAPTETKKWSAKVRCMLPGAWKLEAEALKPIAPGIHVDAVERKSDESGDYYEIMGRYGPGLEEGAIGGNLLFKTDRDGRNVMLTIRASVRERVKINKTFFSFNRFSRAKGAEQTLYIWPTDLAKGSLEVSRVEVVRGTHKDGGIAFEIVRPAAAPGDGKAAPQVTIPGRDGVGIPADKLWRIVVRAKPGLELKRGRRLSVSAKIHFKGEGMVGKSFRFNGFPTR